MILRPLELFLPRRAPRFCILQKSNFNGGILQKSNFNEGILQKSNFNEGILQKSLASNSKRRNTQIFFYKGFEKMVF